MAQLPNGQALPAFTPASFADDDAYTMDFSLLLGTDALDVVAGVTVTANGATTAPLPAVQTAMVVTMPGSPAPNTAAVAWLSGGQPGVSYTVSFSVVTLTGRALTRSALLAVSQFR